MDALLAVVEPYFRSLEAGRRIVDLARELEVPTVYGIANKVRDAADEEAIGEFAEAHGLPIAAWIPYDGSLIEAERAGSAPIDHDPEAPAVREIRGLAERLAEERPGVGPGRS